MALTLLDRVRQFLTPNPLQTGQNAIDAVKGFVGATQNAGDQFYNRPNSFTPTNVPQKAGNIAGSLLTDLTLGKNAGINDSIDQLLGTVANVLRANPTTAGIIGRTQDLFTGVKPPEPPVVNAADTIVKDIPPVEPRPTTTLFQSNGSKLEQVLQPGDVYAPKGTLRKTAESVLGDTSIQGSKGVIKNSGPAGEMIYNLLNKSEMEGSRLAGEATLKLQNAMRSLTPQEVQSFADVVEGKLPPISVPQANAVNVWKNIATDVNSLAKEAGIEMGTIQNYFPHFTTPMSKEELAQFADKLVSEGKFNTAAEALQALQKESSALPRSASRRFGNLELSRESNLAFNKDPNVLYNYIENAYKRIADANNFGKNDEVLYKLAKATGTQGGDSTQVATYLDQILGKNQTNSKVANTLMQAQTVTKLNPGTSLTNLTQNISTALRTDVPSTLKAVSRTISNPDEAFARAIRVGEIGPETIKGLEDYAGSGNVASKWIRLIGMGGTEQFNRVVAVNAGMDYAESLAAQAAKGSEPAIRELARLGVSPEMIDATGKLSEDALLNVGRQVSKETQFATGAGDLPYAWKTNAGKVITQFKSFAYKQTGFLKDQAGRVLAETKAGNIKPLINALEVYGVAAPIAGEVVNDFKSLLKNKKRTDVGSFTERYISNILAATSFGLLDSTGGLLGQYGEGGIVSTVGGPTVSDAQKAIQGVADVSGVIQGNSVDLKPDARNVLREIPAVGGAAANTLVPNSYVQNYVGPNNGLNANDQKTYGALKQTDAGAAETFKTNNQAQDKNQQPNLLQKLFGGGGQFDWNTTPTSKKGKTEYNSMVDKALENGASVPDKALLTRFFNGNDYQGAKTNASKEKVLKAAVSVQQDQYLTEEQKSQIIASAKINPDDLNYYSLASMSEDQKIQGTLDYLDTNQLSHDQIIQALALNKRRVGGAYITTPGVLDRLYDGGYISKQDKALLTAIKWDSVYNKFYIDRDYKGSGTSTAQAKAYINKINSIFSTKNKQVSLKTAFKQKGPKAPKALTF